MALARCDSITISLCKFHRWKQPSRNRSTWSALMRDRLAMILLYMSWPVCLIHRYWNNAPYLPVRWIRFDRTVYQDFRWYLVRNEDWASELLILSAFLVMRTKTFPIRTILLALFLVCLLDLGNYWLYFRRNEGFLTAESLVMLFATFLNLKHAYSR